MQSLGREQPGAYADIIHKLLEQPGVMERVREELSLTGFSYDSPCLKLEVIVEDGRHGGLEESDIRDVFSVFGAVQNIRIVGNVALIDFEDPVPAYFAQKTLNERNLPQMKAKIYVSWYSMPKFTWDDLYNNSKYTCRYAVQIGNDKEFQVARRIIGPKGCNMKRIVQMCVSGMAGQAHDIIKIRLRGKGSGFKEGPNQTESKDPLHICISSRYYEKYALACQEIETLLTGIYRDYRSYCQMRRIPIRELNIKKYESGSRDFLSFIENQQFIAEFNPFTECMEQMQYFKASI